MFALNWMEVATTGSGVLLGALMASLSLPQILLAFSSQLWILIATMFVIGVMESVVNTIAPSVNQKIIPAYLMGRVISLMIVFMSGSEPLARAGSGWMIQNSGPTIMLACAGVLEVPVALLGYFMPVVRKYGKESSDGNSCVQVL